MILIEIETELAKTLVLNLYDSFCQNGIVENVEIFKCNTPPEPMCLQVLKYHLVLI